MPAIRSAGLALLVVSALVAVAAPGAAARWSAPATLTPADRMGNCLRGAGADRLALLGELTATTAATDLPTVVPGADPALTAGAVTNLGWLLECADVGVPAGGGSEAPSPDAPALLAAPVHVPGQGTEVRVAAPGAAPVTLARAPRGRFVTAVRVGLAANGAAIVVWVERGPGFHPERATARLATAYRPAADAAFGAPRPLARVQYQAIAPPVVGIDAAGRATVAWHGGGDTGETALLVAETDAGGRFGRPQRLVRMVDGGPSALAVAPDGRALLATGGWEGPGLFERRGDGERFAAVPGAEVPFSNETAVALGRDGAALVATRQDDHVVALHRAAGARRFTAPQRLAGRPALGVSFVEIDTIPTASDRPGPMDGSLDASMTAALDEDGRPLLTWTRGPTRWRAAAAMAAAGDAAGRFADAAPLGSRCRAATAVRPVPLAGGGLGVAWTDLGRLRESGAAGLLGYTSVPSAGDGRLNVVVPRSEPAAGASEPRRPADASRPPARTAASLAAADLPVPRVTARVVGPRALRIGAPLRLRVRCPRDGSPCAVRAAVTARAVERRDGRPRRFGGDEPLSDATTLAPGAAALLLLDPSPGMRVAPLGRGHARIALTSCAPSTTAAVRSELRPRMRGLPRTPAPRLIDVRARRKGGAVRVTGRLSRPARGAGVTVHGARTESHASVELRGRTRFGVTLEGAGAARAGSVAVSLSTQERWNADQVTVPVGGRRTGGGGAQR